MSEVQVLAGVFAGVADPRAARGVRHPVAAVLTLITLAVLCGAGNFRQAADRIAEMPQPLLAAAGARRHRLLGVWLAPGRDTVRRLAALVDADVLDQILGRWLAERIAAVRPAAAGTGLAIDGKTVRHSSRRPRTGTEVQLFSALRHDTAVVIAQLRVPAGTTEVTQVEALLDPVAIAGMVVTGDAAHPSTATAAYLHARGAGYVFTVKRNRRALLTAITGQMLAAGAQISEHASTQRRNGHRVTRTIQSATTHDLPFPAAAQVFRIRREVHDSHGRRISQRIVHGVTSLSATAAEIAGYIRTHWWIENKSHWIRDVVLGEDRHHAWTGNVVHTMAALRNLAIALIRLAGHTRIKHTMEQLHGNKMLIPPLLNASHQHK